MPRTSLICLVALAARQGYFANAAAIAATASSSSAASASAGSTYMVVSASFPDFIVDNQYFSTGID
jgi:hypothetical protein